MGRLGDGFDGATAAWSQEREILPISEQDAGEEEPTALPAQYEVLADACRGKVGRLVGRMTKRLDKEGTDAQSRVVQLAAVLSVVHALRRMEQRTEWRSRRLKLVDQQHEWQLLVAGGLAMTWGVSSLARLAGPGVEDGGGFEELSIAVGLLAWLAWDVEVDMGTTVEGEGAIDGGAEREKWLRIQVVAAVATALARDEEAMGTLREAVGRTPRKGTDGSGWVARHLRFGEGLSAVAKAPSSVQGVDRRARAGDLVVLAEGFDPRVRVALEVTESGVADNIAVLDVEADDCVRRFRASYVAYTGWSKVGL